MCSQHVHLCVMPTKSSTTEITTVNLCVCVPGSCPRLRLMFTWWLCLRGSEESWQTFCCNTRKSCFLHTKALSRSNVKEELVSSCSEEWARYKLKAEQWRTIWSFLSGGWNTLPICTGTYPSFILCGHTQDLTGHHVLTHWPLHLFSFSPPWDILTSGICQMTHSLERCWTFISVNMSLIYSLVRGGVSHQSLFPLWIELSPNDFRWWVWDEQIRGRGCGTTTTTAQYLLLCMDLVILQLLESLCSISASNLYSGLPQRVSLSFYSPALKSPLMFML